MDKSSLYYSLVTKNSEIMQVLYNICIGCAMVKKSFNMYDRFNVFAIPFYQPKDDENLYGVESMHTAQAVVLILKAGLPASGSPLKDRINELNSKITTPQILRDKLMGLPYPHHMKKYNLVNGFFNLFI